MSFMFFLPFFLFAPLTGLLADRLPRRALMVVADLVRCVIVFFLAAIIAGTDIQFDVAPDYHVAAEADEPDP